MSANNPNRRAKKYIDGTAHLIETSRDYRPTLIPYATPPEMRAALARASAVNLVSSRYKK